MNLKTVMKGNNSRLFFVRLVLNILNIPEPVPMSVLDVERIRRIYMFMLITIIGIFMLIPLGIFALYQKNTMLGVFDLTLSVILILNIIHARYNKDKTFRHNIYLGITFTAFLFIYAFLTGGVKNSAYVWYFTFPLIASFILGSRKGAISSLLIYVPAFLLFVMKDPPPFFALYSMDLKIRFSASFWVVAAFSYLFESLREKNMRELNIAYDELEERVEQRTAELRTINIQIEKINKDLSVGLSETFDALKKIAAGDPTVRLSEKSDIELISQLKHIVNMTAKEIGEIVEQSHEIAISLAEHFDVLHKVSQGDLNARVTGNFRSELSESLKTVTNDMIQNIKLSRDALQESEEKYSNLFQHSNDAIFLYDLEGKILDVNQKVLDQFEYSKAELLSLKIFNLHPEEVLPTFQRFFKKVFADGDCNYDIDFVKKNGDVFSAEVSSSLFEIGGKKFIQGIVRDITNRKRAEEQIIYMAYHDPLTNLPNRHLLRERFQRAIASAKQYNRMVAILFLDLDNFKKINDTLGHNLGDHFLQEVASRLEGYIRNSDTIARLSTEKKGPTVARVGGDEFTILLSEINDIKDAASVAQRILNLFNESFHIQSHEVMITPSIGISVYPDDGNNVDILLKNADAAMYHAKDQGKNNYQFYRESMNISTIERLDLEHNLRKALEQQQFVLHYQPLLDLKSRRIIGIEALVRWIHPKKGIIYPLEFIPTAEETGLIIPIGDWILRTACKQNKSWQDAGLAPIRVTINISSLQFTHSNFVETVRNALQESGLDPQYLELELTENILMQTTDTAVTTLKALKSLGVRLAIDDFGTGYCSLNYLKSFPIDTLKIDQLFVKDLVTSQDDKAIINAIIALGHSLRLEVVAEGVETSQQLEYLSQKGSDTTQGFLFSKPLPENLLRVLLESEKARS